MILVRMVSQVAFLEIVGSSVVQVVQEFFLACRIRSSLNFNVMTLIPKTTTTLRVKHYRPIAMSNFIFKVITRIIVIVLELLV